jgi:hypothetical protein
LLGHVISNCLDLIGTPQPVPVVRIPVWLWDLLIPQPVVNRVEREIEELCNFVCGKEII